MARKPKTINLPRGYISWSQLVLWEKDPEEYMRIYFYGGESRRSKYMDFGSEVADDAENGSSARETVKAINMLLPTYPKAEHKIYASIKTPHGILNVHGRLDQFKPKPLAFRERKTGTVAWTQAKVDRHGQIDYYYMLIYLDTGKLPESASLDWAQTRVNEDGDIELTGEHKSFIATRTMTDTLRMINRTTKAALEIAAAYEAKLMAV